MTVKPLTCTVLGGSGYLGSYLCEALSARGHAVRVFDRNDPYERWPDLAVHGLEWQRGDFLNEDELRRAVAGRDVVYHLICTTPSESNRDAAADVRFNVLGTLALIELGRQGEFGKLVFVSSGGYVYGVARELPIKETHPTEPRCAYGIGKLTIEKYLSMYNYLYELEYCILRLANVFGARQPVNAAHGVVSVFLDKVLRGGSIEVWGDGSIVRDYVHVSDVTDALLRAGDYRGEEPLFNIGSGVGRSIDDVVATIESTVGRPVERRYRAARPLDVPTIVLDSSKARRLLGWEPRMPFEDGVVSTMNWLKQRAETRTSA